MKTCTVPHRTIIRRLGLVATATLLGLVGLLLIARAMHSMAAPDTQEPESARVGVAARVTEASGPVSYYPNCRFGVGGGVNGFGVTPLNIGVYMDWSAQITPARPNGAEYIQVVRLRPGPNGGYVFTPTTATLQAIMAQNPGATWLIGNEPDSIWNDSLHAEDYARAYHDLYRLIKQHDPFARVGAGSIVQPTPLRLEYLDRALSTYQQLYGEPMPTDLWSIHSYILRETTNCFDGACIPPGFTATQGIVYAYADMFNPDIFQQRLIDFRTWMRDRGYRDKPLYVTEYGTLFPYPPYIEGEPYVDENGVPMDEARSVVFMTSTFDILLNLNDRSVGYPADANRLVQSWLWYSVSDPSFGGLLFDPTTHQRRPLSNVFAAYTQAISPSVDLLAVRVIADPGAISYTGQLETTTLKAQVSNIGNISITAPITVAFYSGTLPTGMLIGSQAITAGLGGCAVTAQVSVTWANLDAGAHPMYVQIDPDDTINEVSKGNNVATGFALIATQHVYLPVIVKGY